jgi:hypothetical protein
MRLREGACRSAGPEGVGGGTRTAERIKLKARDADRHGDGTKRQWSYERRDVGAAAVTEAPTSTCESRSAACTTSGDAGQRSVILCEGIPDTLSVLVAELKDTGACGLYGTGGWQSAWLPLFRRTARVYVALDRDATDRSIALARTFGTRGRVLIPPEELGPKGDLND